MARMGGGRCGFKILTGKTTGNKPIEKLRRAWENNIKNACQIYKRWVGHIARM